MKEFNQLCKELEHLDATSYTLLLAERAERIIPALSEVAEDGVSGLTLYGLFLLGALAADGRLSNGEFEIARGLLEPVFGDALDYQLLRRDFSANSKEFRNCANFMVKVLALLSEELRDDVVFTCMLICAVDGKISLREKNWIKQLYAD